MSFEYSFKAVDERIEMYEKFDEENYEFMIDEANRIINQYKQIVMNKIQNQFCLKMNVNFLKINMVVVNMMWK